MAEDMITDITLDHLPDLSETSVSFQIPTNTSADLLLADHTGGFDLLCNAIDDDTRLGPTPLGDVRGPLLLAELTPRPEASRPTPRPQPPTSPLVPSSSAKPSVSQRPPTLGHRSPDKSRRTPSRAPSVHRQLESPFVSEGRFDQLRAQVETLGRPDVPPSHAQVYVAGPSEDVSATSNPPSRVPSDGALDSPPPSTHTLDPLPEEKETSQDVDTPAEQDAITAETIIPVFASRPEAKRNPRTRARPTLTAGDMSKLPGIPVTHVSKKAKRKPSCIPEAYRAPPSAARQITPPQSISIDTEEELIPSACISGDNVLKSENTQIMRPSTGGMTERLVSYSQRLISSIGLSKPCPESLLTEAAHDAVGVANAHAGTRLAPSRVDDTPGAHSAPFRLSEISPHKQPPNVPQPGTIAPTETVQHGERHIMAPKRAAKKRVSTDVDLPEECQRRKKEKITPANANSDRRSSDEATSQAPCHRGQMTSPEDQPVTNSETCDSTHHPSPSKLTVPSARTKYRPKPNSSLRCKGPTLDPFPYLSSSRVVHGKTNRDRYKRDGAQTKAASVWRQSANAHLRRGRRTESYHGSQRSGPISTTDLPLAEKQNATLPVAPLTKPVGFTFRVDSRLGARKVEERLAASAPEKTHAVDAVPGCKVLRTSHQAEWIIHRTGAVPSVPIAPFFFCTEQRAKEREKFDETVRRKQEEMERLKEEQRRREAEEEEREIKALRRRAIPKANEVPEWYADMPKRKGTAV